MDVEAVAYPVLGGGGENLFDGSEEGFGGHGEGRFC